MKKTIYYVGLILGLVVMAGCQAFTTPTNTNAVVNTTNSKVNTNQLCGDSVCDTAEAANPTFCPKDCGSKTTINDLPSDVVTNNSVQPADQNDPGTRDLMIRTSTDGTNFSEATVFEEHAGVPSAVRTDDGRIISAFQYFPEDKIAAKISTDDGATWSDPEYIMVNGLPNGYTRPFDPTVTVTPEGRLRLYFTSEPNGSRMFEDTTAIYSAIGDDGINFTYEPNIRLAAADPTFDAAAIYWQDQWLMIVSDGNVANGAGWGTSENGVDFTEAADSIPNVGGVNWTGNLVSFGDTLRFYGNSQQAIWWASSSDGVTWSNPINTNFRGGDPAVVQATDGDYIAIYVE